MDTITIESETSVLQQETGRSDAKLGEQEAKFGIVQDAKMEKRSCSISTVSRIDSAQSAESNESRSELDFRNTRSSQKTLTGEHSVASITTGDVVASITTTEEVITFTNRVVDTADTAEFTSAGEVSTATSSSLLQKEDKPDGSANFQPTRPAPLRQRTLERSDTAKDESTPTTSRSRSDVAESKQRASTSGHHHKKHHHEKSSHSSGTASHRKSMKGTSAEDRGPEGEAGRAPFLVNGGGATAADPRTTQSSIATSTATSTDVAKQGKLDASAAAIVLDACAVQRAPLLKNKSTSLSSSQRGASSPPNWKLKYQDFFPSRGGEGRGSGSTNWGASSESFQRLVDRSNDWLKKNGDVQVKICETVTWISHDRKCVVDSELMVLSKRVAEDVNTYCVRGLRLWLMPQATRKPQHIGFVDISPTNRDDNIQKLVTVVNDQIEHNQIKGQILTVETLGVRLPYDCDVTDRTGPIDTGTTRWTDSANVDCPYSFVLRIFYNKEVNGRIYGSERAQIGIKDVIPLLTNETYEGFEDLIERTNLWLKDQTDILITNMQSVMVQKNIESHNETGSDCFYSQPGINRPLPVDFFRILRVAYLKPVGDLLVNLPVIYPFTYETFTPDIHKERELRKNVNERLERMKETFTKITAFLKTSGADVICAETVLNPMQMYPREGSTVLPPVDEIKFLLTLRLYLTKKVPSIDALSTRSVKRSSVTSTQRSGGQPDNEHPGPIFLRHVVTRRFKYRWMILATTAITCMTIVVIVSVVYSNL